MIIRRVIKKHDLFIFKFELLEYITLPAYDAKLLKHFTLLIEIIELRNVIALLPFCRIKLLMLELFENLEYNRPDSLLPSKTDKLFSLPCNVK